MRDSRMSMFKHVLLVGHLSMFRGSNDCILRLLIILPLLIRRLRVDLDEEEERRVSRHVSVITLFAARLNNTRVVGEGVGVLLTKHVRIGS